MKSILITGIVVLLGLLAAACGAKEPTPAQPADTPEVTNAVTEPVAIATPEPTSTLSPTDTPAPTPTPAPIDTPVPTSTPAPLTTVEIFAKISPSLAFIQTGSGTGSGVLIEGGYVVTNAHVVWPFEEVRVAFPDGSEFLDAPVFNSDPLGDLAVIGPLNTSIAPLNLTNGEDLAIGSEVFLIGYPAEGEASPQPTITRGILSRLREWQALGVTYLQTDAAIAGGQSGGVLVSGKGDVIGISGLSFSEAGFGLVASGADILSRIEGLVAGRDVARLGNRQIPLGSGPSRQSSRITNPWGASVYVINSPLGETMDINVDSEEDLMLILVDVFGNFLFSADSGLTGIESGSAPTTVDAPHFALVMPFSADSANFTLNNSHGLTEFNDPDDGIVLAVGQTIQANMDYPFDFDYFFLDLAEGQTVEITADSMNFDPFLEIDYEKTTGEVTDDDSGGGIFGTNAKLVLMAPHSARYTVVVRDADVAGVGGYFLTVADAPADAIPFPIAPPAATVDSPFGPMEVYESARHPFSIQHPAGWTDQLTDQMISLGLVKNLVGENRREFAVAEEDLSALGLPAGTQDEYVDTVLSVLESIVPGLELTSRDTFTTAQGVPTTILEFNMLNGVLQAKRLVVLDNNIGFNATYIAPKAQFSELEPLIDYSFSTFMIEGLPEARSAPESSAPGTPGFKQYAALPPITINIDSGYIATIHTNKGEIIIELSPSLAPNTVNNFIFLTREGFYDGVIFHRVIEDFMIQGGDPTGTGTGGPGYEFGDEIESSLDFGQGGVIAMANSGPDTNGSQFFITVAPAPHLNGAYTIFGQVTQGQDVAEAISKVATEAGDRPVEPITIESIEFLEYTPSPG